VQKYQQYDKPTFPLRKFPQGEQSFSIKEKRPYENSVLQQYIQRQHFRQGKAFSTYRKEVFLPEERQKISSGNSMGVPCLAT
jgi:hypothetical protein